MYECNYKIKNTASRDNSKLYKKNINFLCKLLFKTLLRITKARKKLSKE